MTTRTHHGPATTTVHVTPATVAVVHLARDAKTVFVDVGDVTFYGAPSDVDALLAHAMSELRRVVVG